MLARTLNTISKAEEFVFYTAFASGVKHRMFHDTFFHRFEKVEQIVRRIFSQTSQRERPLRTYALGILA